MKTNEDSRLNKYLNASESDLEEKGIKMLLKDEDQLFKIQTEYIDKFKSIELPKNYSPFDKLDQKNKIRWIGLAAVMIILLGTTFFFIYNVNNITVANNEWKSFTVNDKLLKLRAIENNDATTDILELRNILSMEKDINLRLYIIDILQNNSEDISLKMKEEMLEKEENPMLQVALVELFKDEKAINIDTQHLVAPAQDKLKNLLK